MAKKIGLERTLGLLEVTIFGVGIILGAGIYALIGEAAGNAVWISFALLALPATSRRSPARPYCPLPSLCWQHSLLS
ncbi:MAG: hypothetical protein WCZ26_10130 [Methanothrix soehngenii]|nr:hypothetical protein [Methanothrix soehngenii]MDD5734458.1 hypothetical protein [Methanothrix soehngenii]